MLYSGLQSRFAAYSTNMVFGHQCGISVLCDVTNIFWTTEQARARKSKKGWTFHISGFERVDLESYVKL